MTATHHTRRWEQVKLPAAYRNMWHKQYGTVPVPVAWESGPLRALLGREPVADRDLRWHLSVSREDRVPSWDEMVTTAHDLRPGVPFAVPIPPRSWWINWHPYTLHVWEVKDRALVDMWRQERRGDVPT